MRLEALQDPWIFFVVAVAVLVVAFLLPRRRVAGATRMLHVPFTLLKDEKQRDAVQRSFRIPSAIANALRGKHFESPADLLHDETLRKAASPHELYKLAVPPRYDLDAAPTLPVAGSVEIISRSKGSVVAQLWTLNGSRRVAIASPISEIISMPIDGNNGLIPAGTRIGGFWWWQIPKLDSNTRAIIFRQMVEVTVRQDLRQLASNRELLSRGTPDSQVPRVAQAALFIVATAGGGSTVAGNGAAAGDDVRNDIYDPGGMDPGSYPESDKCSYSPDWPFAECCVAHDYCYLQGPRGCDDCARLQCDLDFLNCMLRIAGTNPALQEMAFIYFAAVRAFGDVGDGTFQYCEGSNAGGFNLNKLLVIAIGLGTIGVSVSEFMAGSYFGGLGALAAGIAAIIIAGKILCELCGVLEEWVEKCEEDRIKRERDCKKRKKKCKKGGGMFGWAKKAWCHIKHFIICFIVEKLIQGACALVKVTHQVVC